MFHAAIAGTGSAAPSRVLTNADIEKMVDTSDEWIKTRTGISERRMAGEGDVLSDFCVEAGEEGLAGGGPAAEELHRPVVAARTPHQPDPARRRHVPAESRAEKGPPEGPEAAGSGVALG